MGCAAWKTTVFDGVYKYNKDWRVDDTAWVERFPVLFVRRCTRPDGWFILRIGPIRAQGQDTKHAIGMSNLVPSKTCVQASVLAPVEEDGTLLGEPPLVQHHVHVIQHTSIFEDMRGRGYPLFDRFGRRFHYHPQWADHRHGGQCDARRGGAACLNRSYPTGYGQLFSDAANIDLELIEMSAGGVVVPAEFWYEASFQYCQAARPRLLAPEVWGSPFDMRLCVLSATCPLNFTFVVPRNATSALWYAVEHRDDGTMLSFDLHTHEHLVRAYIFRGAPELVGLNQARPAAALQPGRALPSRSLPHQASRQPALPPTLPSLQPALSYRPLSLPVLPPPALPPPMHPGRVAPRAAVDPARARGSRLRGGARGARRARARAQWRGLHVRAYARARGRQPVRAARLPALRHTGARCCLWFLAAER